MGGRGSKLTLRQRSRYGVVGESVPLDSDSDDEVPHSPTVHPTFRRGISYGPLSETDAKAAAVTDTRKYVYPFENLVFEGGGNKGLAYCGALKEMEEMGILDGVKRLAGTSAGAMTAALLAVGFSSDQIKEFLSQDLRKIFLDHSCGYFSLLPNLLRSYGWNPGKKIFSWFGERLFEATQNRDITFREVHEMFGKELCVVVTNLTQMSVMYCHVKTTPDMPVRVAVRMSMAIPGLFAAMKHTSVGQTDIFVDGGVLCNYPIHCFDGWWLCMHPDNSFLKKLQPLSQLTQICEHKNRFGSWNDKTIGFLLYAENETEVFRDALEARRGLELPEFPNTALARQFTHNAIKMEKVSRLSRKISTAVDNLLKVLDDNDVNGDSVISLSEFEKTFHDPSFSSTDRSLLFGEKTTAAKAFEDIRRGQRENVSYQDIMRFLEINGIHMHALMAGLRRTDVKNFAGFLGSLEQCLATNVKRAYMEERDVDRTVGINTGYLGTTDFYLQKEDREYLVEQGRRSFVTFLKYYIAEHDPPEKKNPVERIVEGQEEPANHSKESNTGVPDAHIIDAYSETAPLTEKQTEIKGKLSSGVETQ